jgi:hypothetical protein
VPTASADQGQIFQQITLNGEATDPLAFDVIE